MSDTQKLADVIHEKTCKSNHIDMCGYHYSNWDSPNWDRNQFLDRAEKAMEKSGLSAKDVIKAIEAI